MPTGYTAAVANGEITELKDFAYQCARGMGALIMMRDDPTDAPIPDRFEPSDYHKRRLEETLDEREKLQVLSQRDLQDLHQKEIEKDRAYNEKREKQFNEQLQRYEAMISKVRKWKGAPEGLKEFMLSQLTESMDFDCRGGMYIPYSTVEPNFASWVYKKLSKINKDIEYHTIEQAKEVERTEGRNLWIAQLKESLRDQ